MANHTINSPILSVAELKALQLPAVEQTQTILHLTLKELALLGWIKVRRGERPTPMIYIVIMVVLCIIAGFINPFLLILGAIFLGYKIYLSDNNLMLIEPTEKGRAIANSSAYPAEYNQFMLGTLVRSVNNLYGNCTVKEWRKSLGELYNDNADFYKRALLVPLSEKKLLRASPDGTNFQRTPDGDVLLKTMEQRLQRGSNLSYLLRTKSPDAVATALALGTLVLLMPELDGYYQPMASMIQGESLEVNQRREPTEGSSDGGSSDSGNWGDYPDKDDLDYDSSSDFLDGSFDAGGSESGCGVGSDGGGDGGCGSDGGGDGGCGSGCGGCGGGD